MRFLPGCMQLGHAGSFAGRSGHELDSIVKHPLYAITACLKWMGLALPIQASAFATFVFDSTLNGPKIH